MNALLQPDSGPLVLALDSGTSSVRATLFDEQGRATPDCQARRAYALQTGPDGSAVLDADQVCAAAMACIDDVLAQAGAAAGRIAGIGGCTLVANLLGLDGAGRPVTPLYTWADTRGQEAVAWLRAQVDENAAHQRTGCLFHTSYWPARLRWLQTAAPDLARRVHTWLSLDDYLRLQLFGQMWTSYSVASWSGLLDRQALAWDGPLLALLGLEPERLPAVADRDQPQQGLRPSFARRWPALARVPWFPALGDGAASNLGSGGTRPGQVVTNLGTSAAVRLVVPGSPPVPPGLWAYRVDRDLSLLGGSLSNAGNVYEWLNRTLQLGPAEEVEAALAALEPDGHGLTLLPFLAGERAPGWAGQARAAITGLSLHTRPLDILQAALEAVAYRLALVHDLLAPLPAGDDPVLVSGGAAARSPAWLQMIADVVNRPLALSAGAEASSRGVALSVWQALGRWPELAAAPMPPVVARFRPDAGRHQRYREAMARQAELYRRLGGMAEGGT